MKQTIRHRRILSQSCLFIATRSHEKYHLASIIIHTRYHVRFFKNKEERRYTYGTTLASTGAKYQLPPFRRKRLQPQKHSYSNTD